MKIIFLKWYRHLYATKQFRLEYSKLLRGNRNMKICLNENITIAEVYYQKTTKSELPVIQLETYVASEMHPTKFSEKSIKDAGTTEYNQRMLVGN